MNWRAAAACSNKLTRCGIFGSRRAHIFARLAALDGNMHGSLSWRREALRLSQSDLKGHFMVYRNTTSCYGLSYTMLTGLSCCRHIVQCAGLLLLDPIVSCVILFIRLSFGTPELWANAVMWTAPGFDKAVEIHQHLMHQRGGTISTPNEHLMMDQQWEPARCAVTSSRMQYWYCPSDQDARTCDHTP